MPMGSCENSLRPNQMHCKSSLKLSSDNDPKTYSDSRALLTVICDMDFIIGLCMLKVILSNTHSLCQYLQEKNTDVLSARRIANMTMETLHRCRSEQRFGLVWQMASLMGTEGENVASQFSIWVSRSQDTTTSLQACSPFRGVSTRTYSGDARIPPPS